MKDINEVFFKDKYERYKDAVISNLKSRGINVLLLGQYFEEYCKDFFLDNMTVDDCVKSIAEDRIAREKQAITEAIRIMREHGYRVRPYKK